MFTLWFPKNQQEKAGLVENADLEKNPDNQADKTNQKINDADFYEADDDIDSRGCA